MSDLLRAIMRRISSGRNIRGQRPKEPVKENYQGFYEGQDDYGAPIGGTRDVSGYSPADVEARRPTIGALRGMGGDVEMSLSDTTRQPSEHNLRKAANDIERDLLSTDVPEDSRAFWARVRGDEMLRTLARIIEKKQRGRIIDAGDHFDPHNRRITGSFEDGP